MKQGVENVTPRTDRHETSQVRILQGAMIKSPLHLGLDAWTNGNIGSFFIVGNIREPKVELVSFYGRIPEMSRGIKVPKRSSFLESRFDRNHGNLYKVV